MKPCEIVNRLLVFGFVGLLLATHVDFPGLAILAGFTSAIAFYAVEEHLYPRFAPTGHWRGTLRGLLIFFVGHTVGMVVIGFPLLYGRWDEPFTYAVFRDTLCWGAALGLGVGAVGTVLYSFQKLASKSEDQQRALAETARQAAELRELVARAETAALRAQINPHFLYNALNTLAYLTEEDPPAARRVVEKLARIFRRTLERSSDAMTSLGDELEFVSDYLGIECERFDDVLRVATFIDPATLEARVPTMMLQPLAENSVKHGICPVANGGTLTVRTTLVGGEGAEPRLRIELSDDGRGMDEERLAGVLDGSKGVGLSNVRDRIRLQYGARASVTIRSRLGEGTFVTLDLPFERAAVPAALARAGA